MAASRAPSTLSRPWVRHTRKSCRTFLPATHFPPVERHGDRGLPFVAPEWVIRLIGVLAVTCQAQRSLGMHRLRRRSWHE